MSRYSRGRDVTVFQCLAHPFVGRLSRVVVVGASGVDVDDILEPSFGDMMTKDVFSGRRPTNVAQTDKKHVERRSWHDA